MPTRVISFKADDRLVEKMHRARIRLGLNQSELIRLAIEEFLRKNGFDQPYREESP